MNKTVLLLLAGTLALLTESCSFFRDFSDARKELEENTAKPIPIDVDAANNQNQETNLAEEEFADLEDETEPTQAIAGLIPATNPDVRVRTIARGRQDPFSIVNLTPRIEIEQAEVEEVNRTTENSSSQINRPRVGQSHPSQGKNSQDVSKPVETKVPEPTLAQKVIVSGLYEANDRVKLIVQAPEESTSRYVEVGQYLSNGQVLVKSIDWDHSPIPMVTLEQSGIEVSKEIGETPNASNEAKTSSLPRESSQPEIWLSHVSLN